LASDTAKIRIFGQRAGGYLAGRRQQVRVASCHGRLPDPGRAAREEQAAVGGKG